MTPGPSPYEPTPTPGPSGQARQPAPGRPQQHTPDPRQSTEASTGGPASYEQTTSPGRPPGRAGARPGQAPAEPAKPAGTARIEHADGRATTERDIPSTGHSAGQQCVGRDAVKSVHGLKQGDTLFINAETKPCLPCQTAMLRASQDGATVDYRYPGGGRYLARGGKVVEATAPNRSDTEPMRPGDHPGPIE